MLRDMTNGCATHTEAARAAILAKVDRHKVAHGVADSTISRCAFPSDSMFVGRLRRGENVTLEKLHRLEVWLDRALAGAAPSSAISSVA